MELGRGEFLSGSAETSADDFGEGAISPTEAELEFPEKSVAKQALLKEIEKIETKIVPRIRHKECDQMDFGLVPKFTQFWIPSGST